MKKILAVPPVVLALLAFACSGGSKAAAGTYEMDKAAFKQAMLDLAAAQAKGDKAMMAGMEKMASEMASAMDITLELKADGTFASMTKGEMMGHKVDETETGTWKLDGQKLSMTRKSKDGKEETHVADYMGGVISMEREQNGQKMKVQFRKK